MSVNDNLCYELTSNILRTLKLEHLIDKKISIRDNLQHLLLHKDFVKEFCALHGHKDRSKHMLIEIASQYLDITSIYTFYEHHQLNTNIVKDFNKIFVTYYMQSQIYKEEVDKIIENEMSYFMYLKELKKLTHNYRKCKEIDDLVNLHKILVRNLSTHNIKKVYTNLLQKFRDLYASYISAKPDITQYYHKKISNDTNQNKKKDLLDTIHNLSNTTDSLSKSIDTIFMKPIIHFLSYQTLFTNLQNRSFKNDKTLSFLKNSFIEMTGTINTQMRTDDYEKLYASKRDKIDKIEELESNNTGAIKYIVENELTFRRNLRRYMILFFTNGFAIVSMGRKYIFLEYIDYKRIVKCKIYNEDMMYAVKLVFTGNVREMIVIPIDNEEKAKRIVELTKNREEIVVAKSSYAAKIEFADLLFLIQYSGTESLYAIKKKIIARVGKHFCGDKNIDDDKIDLKLYQNFHFYIRHDGNLYLLENDDDLKAAIMLTEYKLDIVIKNISDDTNMSSDSNCKI